MIADRAHFIEFRGNLSNFRQYITLLEEEQPYLWVGLDTPETHATLGYLLVSGSSGRTEPVLAKLGELVKFSFPFGEWIKVGFLFHPSNLKLHINYIDRETGLYTVEYYLPNFDIAREQSKYLFNV